jgi:isocitrate dehydrogenase (NAD+)
LPQDALKIRSAVEKVLRGGKVRTRDLGGFATTFQFTDAVIKNL